MASLNIVKLSLLASALTLSGGTACASPVYSDATFTNASGTGQGAAIGASGWYFNNVRVGGTAAVSTLHPQSGNGSLSFSGISNSKADVEYLPSAVNISGNFAATASLGLLSSLSSMGYDWYRDSSSTAVPGQQPSLRVLVDRDGNLATTNDRGGLVFERAYNSPTATTDQWVSETINDSTFMWNFGLGLGNFANINASSYAYDSTMADWKAYMPSAVIIGFSSGIGSGWNNFSGAVDNVRWTINGATTSTNFEYLEPAAVAEPGSMALLGLGMLGLGLARRARKR